MVNSNFQEIQISDNKTLNVLPKFYQRKTDGIKKVNETLNFSIRNEMSLIPTAQMDHKTTDRKQNR